MFFFFQAEDGIRDVAVTGVQTCALPISGGQRQRVWIAMALAQETGLLLLDEPTTFLDIAHQVEVLDLLTDLTRHQGRTIVAVLHDLNLRSEERRVGEECRSRCARDELMI